MAKIALALQHSTWNQTTLECVLFRWWGPFSELVNSFVRSMYSRWCPLEASFLPKRRVEAFSKFRLLPIGDEGFVDVLDDPGPVSIWGNRSPTDTRSSISEYVLTRIYIGSLVPETFFVNAPAIHFDLGEVEDTPEECFEGKLFLQHIQPRIHVKPSLDLKQQ